MGRSITPKYVVRMYYRKLTGHIVFDEYTWPGRPNMAKLEDMRKTFNKSFLPGGVNFHISESGGYVPHYYKAQIRHNVADGKVVLEANAPMFEVV